MAVDSNMPYNRVNVQANNNDTIWNGAAWGTGAGVGALGLTYGATTFGARGIDNLASKVAGSKTTRMETRNAKKVHNAMGKVQGVGNAMFGSKKKMAASAAVGLMGGMLAGAGIDHAK